MRALTVNEILLKKYKETYAGDIEMYMNPASARRLGPSSRAISDKDGNLFITYPLANDQRGPYAVATTHTDMIAVLKGEGFCKDMKWVSVKDGYGYYENGMAWQQDNNKNHYYISESYHDGWVEDNINLIEEYISKIKSGQMKYFIKRISLVGFESKSAAEQRYIEQEGMY